MLSDGRPYTYVMFMLRLRSALCNAGYDEALYSSHSLRAGGAGYAQCSGVPGDMIRALGSWQLDAYLHYLEPIDRTHEAAGFLVQKCIMDENV